jgi:hypothetical protein
MSESETYQGYAWIKVPNHAFDPQKTDRQNYDDLHEHHVAETTFLIDKLRELALAASVKSVFIVQHLHVHPDQRECVKLIGAYSTQDAAQAAIERLRLQPGFCDYPRLIDPSSDEEESGFYIDEYELGQDHWTEGFVTMTPGV